LEYRLNFSRYFNIFVYGGVGFDLVTNASFDEYSTGTSLEYGSGLRIDHIQFNIGQSLKIRNGNDFDDYSPMNYDINKELVISVSYMF
jgi:hypothetical protein